MEIGVPHAVHFTKHVSEMDVAALGAAVRHHAHFAPHGTNVNFAQILSPNRLRLRTFERGVEAETLSCGTGAAAAAVLANRLKKAQFPITVETAGGEELTVACVKEKLFLRGAAEVVFVGIWSEGKKEKNDFAGAMPI